MRVLWALPKAAPALLKHAAGYLELLVQDLSRAQHQAGARMLAFAILGISVFFLLLMLCFAVMASTWDTPYRVTAILSLAGFFMLVAIIAALYRGRVLRTQEPFLSALRKEWHEDREILERILSSENQE